MTEERYIEGEGANSYEVINVEYELSDTTLEITAFIRKTEESDDCNGEGDGFNTLHDQVNELRRKTQHPQKLSDKGPLNRVKGLPEVNLHKSFRRGSLFTILPKQLLNQIYAIRHSPTS